MSWQQVTIRVINIPSPPHQVRGVWQQETDERKKNAERVFFLAVLSSWEFPF